MRYNEMHNMISILIKIGTIWINLSSCKKSSGPHSKEEQEWQQALQNPGTVQHGGEYAWHATGSYPKGVETLYPLLVYMCPYDVLLKKM